MTSRFGPVGAAVKRCIARVLRFVVLEQREIDGRLDVRIAAIEAQLAGRTPISAITALAREVASLRIRLGALGEQIADRRHLVELSADVASMEKRLTLRADSDAIATAARFSSVLHELGGVAEQMARLDEAIAATRELVSELVKEHAQTSKALAGLTQERASAAAMRERIAVAEDRTNLSERRAEKLTATLAGLVRQVDRLALLFEVTQQLDALERTAPAHSSAETNEALQRVAGTLLNLRNGEKP